MPETLTSALQSINRFYFIRHGQTNTNLRQVMCGSGWDIDLNETGVGQARRAASGPLNQALDVTTICCSPMRRARQTADILNEVLRVPVIVIDELKEWFVGEWEGKPWGSAPDPFAENKEPPGGETRFQFEQRVKIGFNKSLRHKGPVLIVAHGGVLYCLSGPLGLSGLSVGNCVLHKANRQPDNHAWCAEPILEP